MEFWSKLFSGEGFPARWFCGSGWTDFLGWLHIGSDVAIFLAYMAIPIVLVYFIRKKDVPFAPVFALFAAFILLCGFTHANEAVIFWHPFYRWAGVLKFLTAVVSWLTVIALIPTLRLALKLRFSAAIADEVQLLTGDTIAFWEWDTKSDAQIWTPRFFSLLGYESDAIPADHESWQSRLHPEDRERTESAIQGTATEGADHDAEFRLRVEGGGYRWFRSRGGRRIDEEGALKVFGALEDIDEAARATRELRRSNADLEQFAYVASHDLKAPLRGIKLVARFLEEDHGEQLGEDGQQRLGQLTQRVSRMENLLDDLLAYSRAGRTEDSLEEVDLTRLVEGLAADLDTQVLCYDLPTARFARTPLETVLRNLIGNAVKHGRPPVTVSCTEEGAHWRFSVRDEGEGIPKKYHDRAFELFQTLKPRDEVEGSGMGLAMVKRLVLRHEGRIEIQDSEGGLDVHFTWLRS